MKGFEERLTELEKITDDIRNREIPLEKAMKLFDEGVEISKGLEKELEGFERKVEVLKNEPAENGSGEPELEEF